jgi:hypothetical protein
MPTEYIYDAPTGVQHVKVVAHDGTVVSDEDVASGILVSRYELNRTWVRTPGYYSGVKSGATRRFDLPMNPYSYMLRRATYPQGTVTLTTVESNLPNGQAEYRRIYISGALLGSAYVSQVYPNLSPATMPEIDVSHLNEMALSRLLLSVKDQKVNLVQAYAERRQTARLLDSTIKRVVSAITSLKKGNFAGAASALGVKAPASKQKSFAKRWKEDQSQAVANGWLELQYGWLPLLKDVHGSAELLAQKNLREIRNRVEKSASVTRWAEGESNANEAYPYHILIKIRRKVTVKYVAYWSTSEVNHTLKQVGVTNPLLVAWELLPWSFVYDWFLPIGNYISALDAAFGLTFEKGCKTIFDRVTITGQTKSGHIPYTGQGTGSLIAVSASGGGYSEEYVTLNRVALTEWPDPVLPSFKNPFSGIHLANSLALLKKTVRFR